MEKVKILVNDLIDSLEYLILFGMLECQVIFEKEVKH